MPDAPVTLAEMIEEIGLEISYRERSPWRASDAGLALQNMKRRRLDVMREAKRYLERRKEIEEERERDRR